MFQNRQRLTARWEWVFVTLTSLSVLFFITLLSIQWFGGDGTHWKSGRPKGGDLMQHYAAGLFWKNNFKKELYQDFHLGDWINQQMGYESNTKSIQNFNYVYAPLVAWVFSKAVGLHFYYWILFWMISSIALFFYMWVKLLDRNGFGFYPFEHRKDIFWYGVGLPSLFYALWTFQMTFIFFASLIGAMFLWNKDKKFLAGLLLSVWVIKPHFLVLWVILLFLLKHYRMMWGCIAGGVAFILVSIAVLGFEPQLLWIHSLLRVSDGTQLVHSFNSSWRVFWIAALGRSLPSLANFLYFLTSVGLVIVFLKWIKEGRRRTNWLSVQELPAASMVVLLISPYTGHYEWLIGLIWVMAVYSWMNWSKRSVILLLTFTAVSLFSVVCVATQFSFTPLFMTLWLAWSFQEMIKAQMLKEK